MSGFDSIVLGNLWIGCGGRGVWSVQRRTKERVELNPWAYSGAVNSMPLTAHQISKIPLILAPLVLRSVSIYLWKLKLKEVLEIYRRRCVVGHYIRKNSTGEGRGLVKTLWACG